MPTYATIRGVKTNYAEYSVNCYISARYSSFKFSVLILISLERSIIRVSDSNENLLR